MAPSRVSSVRLDALLQHAREPVFALSAERRIVYVNRAWQALTGRKAEAVLGLACQPDLSSGDGDLAELGAAFCPPAEAFAGEPAGTQALIAEADGQARWRRLEFWPYHDERGALLCVVGLVREEGSAPHVADSESSQLRAELRALREKLRGRYGFDQIVGRGLAHRRLLEQVKAAAATSVPVLIAGEPGTGRRLVARVIHQQSIRASAPLVPFDLALLPPEVAENELFGAPTEGYAPAGELRLAEGSSLLLGDILDLPRDLQSRLASGLDDRVRLLAVTSGDIEQARASDRIRPDLYYALTTLVIRLRPLRDRLDELPLLAQHLLERANLRAARQRGGYSTEALEVLAGYDWPGNMRELARVVDESLTHGRGELIEADDLPAAIRGHYGSAYAPPPVPPPVTPLDTMLTQLERRLIEQALTRARQNKSRAAELLEISRPRLYRRIKELSIPDVPESDNEPAEAARRTAVSAPLTVAAVPVSEPFTLPATPSAVEHDPQPAAEAHPLPEPQA